MSVPYLGEIRLVAFERQIRGWVNCEGQLLQVRTYQALFALLGTSYGGDGHTTFQLPDLRGRTPLHTSPAMGLGAVGGTETVTLDPVQLPPHTHAYQVSTEPGTAMAVTGGLYAAPGAYSATSGPTKFYAVPDTAKIVQLYPDSVQKTGGGLPHPNMQPFLALRYVIATSGVYPSRQV